MREREKKEKKCLNCANDIPNRNVYCDNKCQGEFKRKKVFKLIEEGNTTLPERNYRNYLIEKHGAKCMECGWERVNPTTGLIPVQLEHKDGNPRNNELTNLELLCPSCHSLTPTYGALNKGNGRKDRYK